MGGVLRRSPVSSQFIIGFGIGYTVLSKLPDDYFLMIRRSLFLAIDEASLEIDPKDYIQRQDQATINRLRQIQQGENLNKNDDDYLEMKHGYAQRVVDYADEDEQLAIEASERKEGPEKLHDTIVEFEAVKRLESKKLKKS